MKHTLKSLSLLTLVMARCAVADEDYSSYSYWDFHPLHLGGNVLGIGSAHLDDVDPKGSLSYRKASAFTYLLVPLSRKSYFLPRIEWTTFTMDWSKNPRFRQNQFYYLTPSLTFYTTALDQWRWILRADYNFDIKHLSSSRLYGLFSGLLWGMHEVNKQWNLHIGGLGYAGIRGSQIYPVIGFDYSPDNFWTLLLVFPIEYYIQYKIDPHWKFSIRGRPLKERFRTGQHEPQPRSIFSYSSMGSELNIRYQIFLRLEIEAYGGYNWGGSFYIKNKRGKNALYADLGGAPYGGLNLNWGF